YVFLKNASWEELVPRFRIGEEITHIIFKVAGVVNPSFATLMEGDVTVDEFLMNLETQQRGTSLGVAPEQETLDVFLQSGREQIAELVGRSVEGNEKVSTVLSLALQQRLVMLLNGEKALVHMPSQAIPFFLSLLLFFTLLPILSILGIVWVLVAQLIFFCFLRLGWLALDTVTIQQEKLAK
ncbi:MAG TPA: hypothetical protein VJH89_00700, partial [Patescibacteria group bacterium]|nr:hypothetical protein [Patescibacteria group bacterium]